MSKEFKQSFFTSLMAVLLVVSNLLCLKLTSLLDLTVAVSVFVFPFTFLCTLLLINLGGKKVAYRSVIIAALIQVFITISYYIATKLGTQTQIPDMASQINDVFKINETNLIASLISFITSNCILIYVYDAFKQYGKELYGIALGLLASLFLNVLIYQLITLQNYSDIMFVVNTLLSNIIVSLVMLIIITIIFYLLKEPEKETVEITNMNIDVNKYKSDDLAIEDVMLDKKVEKTTKKKPNNKKNNYKNNSKKTTNNNSKKKTTKKTSKSSQKNVKNERN